MTGRESSDFGARVWRGDEKTVREARQKYLADPSRNNLISFAVVLYSHRRNPDFRREFLNFRDALLAHVRVEFAHTSLEETDLERADWADTLSTHIEWMSRQKELPLDERTKLYEVTRDLCDHGLRIASRLSPTHHAWCLLKLTAARLMLQRRDEGMAAKHLRDVEKKAHLISDPKQRMRVYAKLGFLYGVVKVPMKRLAWGIRGLFVRDVPVAVRKKAFAALLGIDR